MHTDKNKPFLIRVHPCPSVANNVFSLCLRVSVVNQQFHAAF